MKRAFRTAKKNLPVFPHNGVVNCVQYYEKCIRYILGHSAEVGRLAKMNIFSFISTGNVNLESLSTIFGTKSSTNSKWLDNTIIETVISLSGGQNSVIISEVASNVLLRRSDFPVHLVPLSPKPQKLFFPINVNGNHWSVLMADFSKRVFRYYDPSGFVEDSLKAELQKNVVNFFHCHNLKNYGNSEMLPLPIRGWEFVDDSNAYVSQSDGWNCGVYVLKYVENQLTGSPFNAEFDPNAYRTELFQKLANACEDLSEVCVVCFRNDVGGDWVRCESCLRWTHFECEGAVTGKEFQNDPNLVYNCHLCQIYWRSTKI